MSGILLKDPEITHVVSKGIHQIKSNQINQHLFTYKHNIQIQTKGFYKTANCMEAWPIKAKLVGWDVFYKTTDTHSAGLEFGKKSTKPNSLFKRFNVLELL